MFDKRDDLVRLLAVAETGKIHAAADRLAMTQPALIRTLARLEKQFGDRLFERLPTGVRPTTLGERAADLARGVLREMTDAEEKIGMTISGRAGRFGITATPIWMEAVITPMAAGFRASLPGVERVLRTVPPAEGLRLLEAGGERPPFRRATRGRAAAALPARRALSRHGWRHSRRRGSSAAECKVVARRPRNRALDRLRRRPRRHGSPARARPAARPPVPRNRAARPRPGAGRRQGSMLARDRTLSCLAAARLPRPAPQPAAPGAPDRIRAPALPHWLRRPPRRRRPRAVPPAGGRDQGGCPGTRWNPGSVGGDRSREGDRRPQPAASSRLRRSPC